MSFSDVGGNNSTSFNSKLATSQPANWPDLLPVGEKCPTKAEEAKKSSLLEETLMGLQEVSELLQQSLLDIRKEEGSVKGGASDHLSRGRSESDRLRRRSDSHVMTSSARLGQTPAAALMREINGGGNRLMTSRKKIPDTKFPAPSIR